MNIHPIKRCLSLLAALLLILSALPVRGLAEEIEEGATGEILLSEYPQELIVGSPTELRGDFFTEMFGNDTSDIDVRTLIHGYNLVNWDQSQGVYVFDPTVVTGIRVMQDAQGNRTYFLILADDLFYSDGTPITAWDYAFSLLLMMAPEMEEIGAKIYRAEHIRGYDAYLTRRASALAGVEVLSDRQLAVTIDAAFMPFFYEIGLLLCVPYPISVIAPGCRVYDEGQGAFIGNIDRTVTEPIFTAELLRETVLNPETGYNSHPAVSSGPYTLTAFDGETAHFVINPYYKGSWVSRPELLPGYQPLEAEGAETVWPDPSTLPDNYTAVTDEEGNSVYLVRPSIERIAYRHVLSEDVPRLIAEDQLHLVNKLAYGPAINALIQSPEEIDVRMQNYPRLGMTFFSFSCEKPTVHEMAVRQAIAWCMDRDAITQAYTPYGVRVDGYYGMQKWEYLVVDGQIEAPVTLLPEGETAPAGMAEFQNLYATDETAYETMAAAWDALNLDHLTRYMVDTVRAEELLDEAGWTLNRSGKPYRPGIDDVRCKLVDDELVALDLTLLYPEGNHIVDTLEANFIRNLNEAGILLTLKAAPMDELLDSYYRRVERETDMIYLGTEFHVVVDPSITYATGDPILHQKWNNTFSDDEELYARAVEMRQTQPGDVFTYVTRWIAFQERYNQVLPTIPLYSNIYFDFYAPYLQNYDILAHTTWGQAIVMAYFGEDPEPVEEEAELEETEELGEGELAIDDL